MVLSIAAATTSGDTTLTSQPVQEREQTSLSTSITMPLHRQEKSIGIGHSVITYKEAHFLGVPQEIRNRIYEAVRDKINSTVVSNLSQQPFTGFEGLWQGSRQLYHEVPQCLGTFMIPHNMLHSFLYKPIQSHNVWDSFRSLYVEIPHNSDGEVFSRLAYALKQVARELQDLRLYGVGKDAHGVPTSSQTKACGKFDNSLLPYQRKLASSGQGWKVRLPLINSLQYLINLRTLVLDNLNIPLREAHVLKNKPRLESLFIYMDHRTTLHSDYRFDRDAQRMIGNLMWGTKELVQVKELQISMNSAFEILRIFELTEKTIEKLTIIVPDQSKQSACQGQTNWVMELAEIFLYMLRTSKLHTLKVCIHGAVYENDFRFGRLIGAFKLYMPLMSTLRNLELHIQARSSWLAKDFFDYLPPSLERIYVPEIFFTGNFKSMLRIVAGKTEVSLEEYDHTHHRMIGEDLARSDYISFARSKLCFVGYEYEISPMPMAYEIQGKDVYTLLKINAILLDRHRNRHLADLHGDHIPLDFKEPASSKEYIAAVIAARAARLQAPMFDEIPELHVFVTKDDYFGKENEAQEIFYREAVAYAGDLPPLTYPAVEEVSDDFRHSNHWISE